MRDMEARIAMTEKGGAEQLVRKEMWKEISNIETSMEDVVQIFGQQTRARAGRTDGRPDEEGHEVSHEWRAWAVRRQKPNKKEGKVGTRRCGGQEI